jgi:hypothetical protein
MWGDEYLERELEPVPGERVVPNARCLLESMRGVGYTLETSIADLIDNSIAAGARNVSLRFHWSGPVSSVMIIDDGAGMEEAQLVEAMRPGTDGPLTTRKEGDLGRFGLGLKTASLAQCRRLTVVSKQATMEAFCTRSWDLDFVERTNDWLLRRDMSAAAESLLTAVGMPPHGTAVIWEAMDRVVGPQAAEDRAAEEHFYVRVEAVKRHLGMTFHRYLEGSAGTERLRLHINGSEGRHRVSPWDPFARGHPATQVTPVEHLSAEGQSIDVQGYVLPHRDRLTDREYEHASGPAGCAQQGFYVYRNHRLLVAGGWLGLGESRAWTQEEYYKLARISIEFPSTLDAEWHIDIKKSMAVPPRAIRDRLIELSKSVREMSRRVYAHRGTLKGGSIKGGPDIRPWFVNEAGAGPRYLINRSHPLVLQALGASRTPDLLHSVFRLIELTVPVQRIWLEAAEAGDKRAVPADLSPIAEVLPIARDLCAALVASSGLSHESARRTVAATDPFNLYPDIYEMLEV